MQLATGGEPRTIYIDLTDATNDAIGMTGRFMRGSPRDIIALTLMVSGCFFLAMIAFSRPARVQLAQEFTDLAADFSMIGLASLVLRGLAVPIFTMGMLTLIMLQIARASFAWDNLYWKQRGSSHCLIGRLEVSLHDLWRDLHRFQDSLERRAGRRPTRRRRLSRALQWLAGLIAFSPILLMPFKDIEGVHNDNFLFAAGGLAFVLYLISRWVRMPPVGDWHYRTRAWVTRLTGLGIIAAALGITTAGAHLLDALIDSDLLPSAQSSKILAGIYMLLATVLGYGWLYGMFRVAAISFDYLRRARKIGLAQAVDQERRDPRSPITVLRSFADETAATGELSYPKLEATIEESASVYGPLVAAGAPGQLPTGEIGRRYFTPDTWKAGVIDYLDRSLFVLLIPATTAGVKWEIDTIVARDHAGKLILLLLPTHDLATRRRVLIDGFRGTAWERPMADVDFSKALAAYFGPAGGLVVLTSNNREPPDYQLAIHCAVHDMFCRRAPAQ
jgi:hypothetical protein